MSISTGLSSRTLSSGDRYYAYSGVISGDVSVPATIDLLSFTNGLRDVFVKIMPFYGKAVSTTNGHQIGILVSIDGEEVLKSLPAESIEGEKREYYEFFVPKQSTILVQSLNNSNNNTQERGCNLLGWYL